MQKLSLHAMASNSQRGLPQRLSQKCLALIIPKIKQASATHHSKLSKLGKIKKHQNNSKTTQVNSELLEVQTATGQLTEQASTFLLKRTCRWAIAPSGVQGTQPVVWGETWSASRPTSNSVGENLVRKNAAPIPGWEYQECVSYCYA